MESFETSLCCEMCYPSLKGHYGPGYCSDDNEKISCPELGSVVVWY